MCDRGTFSTSDMALKGKTPADKTGIIIGGNSKWLTIIQNAKFSSSNDLTSKERGGERE